MNTKCRGSKEAWYICVASLKGESQTAVGALTNEIRRRQQMSGRCMIHASHYDTLPCANVSAMSSKKSCSAL